MSRVAVVLLFSLAVTASIRAADEPTEPQHEERTEVPFRVTSRSFRKGDRVAIESFTKLPGDSPPRYEIRGRYRLRSQPRARLAPWCAGGQLRDNAGIDVDRGKGTFQLTFSVIKSGELHLSFYPVKGGNSFGSLYYAARDKLPEPPPAEWITSETRYFHLHHTAGNEQDAREVRGYLDQAVKNLATKFGRERTMPLLTSAQIDVYLHPRPNDRAREGLLLLSTGTQDDVYTARIDLLAPSAHDPAATTSVGEPMDGNYIFKNLVHEYGTIVLDRITREKPAGWRFYTAPSWFVQGYEEFLALTLSSEHSLTVTFDKYRDLLRNDPGRVAADFQVKNAYLDGPVLLQFLHETYGNERVQGILTSEAKDFATALEQQTGSSRAELYRAWQRWLRDL